jgi:hypothetical protein
MQVLRDARQSGALVIETEAIRYMRAVGTVAWAVYTYLLHGVTRAGRPVTLADRAVIAKHCGTSADRVEAALRQLNAYGLLEIVEEHRPDHGSTIHVYQILGLDSIGCRAGRPQEGVLLREVFDALLRETGPAEEEINDALRDEVFAAAQVIRRAGGSAEHVKAAAHLYRRLVPDLPLTPRNLAAGWHLLACALVDPASAEIREQR